MASVPLNHATSTSAIETSEEKLRRLEAKWVSATGHLSSFTAIVSHPAFREIVSMGEAAIPLMLRDLQERPRLASRIK